MKEEIARELLRLIDEGEEVLRGAKILSKKYGVKKASILGWFYAEVPKPKVQQGSVLSEEEMG